jgi:hypothetical protein
LKLIWLYTYPSEKYESELGWWNSKPPIRYVLTLFQTTCTPQSSIIIPFSGCNMTKKKCSFYRTKPLEPLGVSAQILLPYFFGASPCLTIPQHSWRYRSCVIGSGRCAVRNRVPLEVSCIFTCQLFHGWVIVWNIWDSCGFLDVTMMMMMNHPRMW